ncbi:MAG: ABC transporter ATP-binding protein [Clostridia bacterium]|nr:ABC transporter ATP-binding protein [Clostridia bacterium]
MLSEVILKVENLKKSYAKKVVVNNLSFQIYCGEIFGLLGPNGAGKTTIMKMITGLCKMEKGDAKILEKSIKKNFEKAIINVGGIIENPEMYENLTGLANLEYFASLYKNVSKKRIEEVVEIVNLKDRIKDKVKTYSLGMKQRLGIAQALLHRPKFLVLDEPTNGLDPESIVEMRKFLKKLVIKEKIGVLLSSHNLSEMELLCDTIGILKNGNLEKVYTIEQLKEDKEKISIKVDFPNFAGKLILNKFGNVPLSILKNTVTIEMEHDKIPQITVLLVSNNINIYSISSMKQTLEDVFLGTINKKSIPLLKFDERREND